MAYAIFFTVSLRREVELECTAAVELPTFLLEGTPPFGSFHAHVPICISISNFVNIAVILFVLVQFPRSWSNKIRAF